MTHQPLTYQASGVNYDSLDPFKIAAQQAAQQTARFLSRFGYKEHAWSRGESAYLLEPTSFGLKYCYRVAHVHEGLGTKNLVADEMRHHDHGSFYDAIAQDTIAMAVNDLITVGALPVIVSMHLAVGHSSWFDDEKRWRDLISGWLQACCQAQCTWGPGETSTLKEILMPTTCDLSCACTGVVRNRSHVINPANIQAGDVIIFLASSGIHANGLTLARGVADRLPNGYLTPLPDDSESFGAALLRPTRLYVPVIEACQNAGIPLPYAINITGHGWRKLMRAPQCWTYNIEILPKNMPPEFTLIQKAAGIDEKEMYATFNMGVGFALLTPPDYAQAVLDIAAELDHTAWVAGYVEPAKMPRVRIIPKGIEYTADTLHIR